MGSFTFTCSKESYQLFWFGFLKFFAFNDPVVVLVNKSEDLSQVLRLFFKQSVENVVLSPLDIVVIVQVISIKKNLLKLSFLQIFEMIRVGSLFDISGTFFHHLKN